MVLNYVLLQFYIVIIKRRPILGSKINDDAFLNIDVFITYKRQYGIKTRNFSQKLKVNYSTPGYYMYNIIHYYW